MNAKQWIGEVGRELGARPSAKPCARSAENDEGQTSFEAEAEAAPSIGGGHAVDGAQSGAASAEVGAAALPALVEAARDSGERITAFSEIGYDANVDLGTQRARARRARDGFPRQRMRDGAAQLLAALGLRESKT